MDKVSKAIGVLLVLATLAAPAVAIAVNCSMQSAAMAGHACCHKAGHHDGTVVAGAPHSPSCCQMTAPKSAPATAAQAPLTPVAGVAPTVVVAQAAPIIAKRSRPPQEASPPGEAVTQARLCTFLI